MTKFFLISSAMMLSGAAMLQAAEPIVIDDFYSMEMSRNGKYMVSQIYELNTFYNIETGETIDMEDMSVGNGNAITGNGIVVGSLQVSDLPAIFIDGKVTYPMDILEKYGTCMLNGVTFDGTRVCGILLNPEAGGDILSDDFQMYLPVVMKMDEKGNLSEPVILPHPAKDFTDRVPQYSSATWISDDGKTIVGNMIDYSGSLLTPIVFKEDEKGEWSYSLPAESLLNPDHVVIPEYPGEFELEEPNPTDYMTPDMAAEYEEDMAAWAAGGYHEEMYPDYLDYMDEEEAEKYTAAFNAYKEAMDEYNEKLYKFLDVFGEVQGASTGFLQNGFTMNAEGTKMAAAAVNVVEGDWYPVEVYSTYLIDLTTGELTHIESEFTNLIPNSFAANGALLLSTPAEDTAQSYLLLPGESTYTPLIDYVASVNPTYAEWMNKNLVGTIEVEGEPDPETGWPTWVTEEIVITGHAVMSEDMSVIAGGTVTYDEEWNPYYKTYLLTDVLSGVSQSIADNSSVKAYKGGRISVEGEAADIAVYDLSGRLVFNAADVKGTVETRLADGIYVVKASANGNITSLKVRF